MLRHPQPKPTTVGASGWFVLEGLYCVAPFDPRPRLLELRGGCIATLYAKTMLCCCGEQVSLATATALHLTMQTCMRRGGPAGRNVAASNEEDCGGACCNVAALGSAGRRRGSGDLASERGTATVPEGCSAQRR